MAQAFMYQSILSVPISSPLGNCWTFAHIVSPWQWGICSVLGAQGLGICVPEATSGNLRRVYKSAMDEFIGKDEAFLQDWLLYQGLDRLVDIFKGKFSQSCNNRSKELDYVGF